MFDAGRIVGREGGDPGYGARSGPRCALALAASWLLLAAPWLLLASAAPAGAQDVVISEFLALGSSGWRDEDGEDSDWIELRNRASAPVDLEGWSLTDDPADLRKWTFPAWTIEAGQARVLFASGKDRREPGGELHTSFRLAAEGGFLALIRPDGSTVEHAYSPSYPPQRRGVSYGLAQTVDRAVLVDAATEGRVRVPGSGASDATWHLPGTDDSAWTPTGPSFGFDAIEAGGPGPGGGAGEKVNLALEGTATQSTTGFGGDASRAIDGRLDSVFSAGSITHTATGDPSPFWQVELAAPSALDSIVLWNRSDCCSRRLSRFRARVLDASSEEVWSEDFFPDGTGYPAPDEGFEVLLPLGTVGSIVRIELLGPNADGELYLSLAEVQVLSGPGGFGGQFETDLGDELATGRTSVHARFPFRVDDPDAVDALVLRVQHDDGFIAFVQGVEVARRNAPPGAATWLTAAATDRPDRHALSAEEVVLSGWSGVLERGDNVLAIHALDAEADDGGLLLRCELEARRVQEGEALYLPEPTPGAPNDTPGVPGWVEDTRFSVDRGHFTEPFDVEITTGTVGAEIRYTTDGSAPTPEHGEVYAGPVRIETTTVLRAAAFREGFGPTNVDTQTYIFPRDVVRQTGAGHPATWGGAAADYAMDPEVVDDPRYRDTIADDLISIPILSIAMDEDHLFGPAGIYSNTEGRGDAWERPCSIELIYPEASTISPAGSGELQTDCGIRIFGYGWRAHSASLKHAFRLIFRREYGDGRLDFRFFPDFDIDRHDSIVLRSQGSRGWNDFRTSIENTQYIRDAWARYTARDMGKLTTSSTYVHLYLNGLYWGLYNPVERPDAEFCEDHLGGREDDYDALNARVGNIEVIDGSRETWDRALDLARTAADPAVYEEIGEAIDLVDLVDYMIIQFYTCNRDWPGSNGNNMRIAGAPGDGGGYRFFCWDMEYSIWNVTDNVLGVNTSHPSPATLYTRLRSQPEFRVLFGDRAHRHLFGDGALTPARAAARWQDRAREIDGAIVGESARWGDRRREPAYTRDVEWLRELDRLLGTFFPQRTEVLVGQLRAVGLYPDVEAPLARPGGGEVEQGSTVLLTAAAGEVWYTLDGSDPRLPGGEVSAGARRAADDVESVSLVGEDAAVRAHVPADDALGLDWTLPGFDDGGWRSGSGGVGYDIDGDYAELIDVDLESEMRGVNASAYIRYAFDADAALGPGGAASVVSLRLLARYEDGFIAYLNGEPVASRNAPSAPAWDSRALRSHADNLAVDLEPIELPDAARLLRPGVNVLALHGLNNGSSGSDFLVEAELEAVTAEGGVEVGRTTRVRARALAGGEWSALLDLLYVIDTPLRVTEIMYHPPDLAEPGGPDADDFEFVELQNVGAETLDLTGVSITGGITFAFDTGALRSLAPGAVALVVKDTDAFEALYGVGLRVAGEYSGSLSNRREDFRLVGPLGETVLEVSYRDDWHPESDGAGRSLERVDPVGPKAAWREPGGWAASAEPLGSPGVVGGDPLPGGRQLPGDLNQDANLDLSDAVALLQFLFAGRAAPLPCGEGTLESRGNRELLDSSGDGGVNISDAVWLLNYLFLGGAPPALGLDCVGLEGCPDVCEG